MLFISLFLVLTNIAGLVDIREFGKSVLAHGPWPVGMTGFFNIPPSLFN
jgi:hypothetical protein